MSRLARLLKSGAALGLSALISWACAREVRTPPGPVPRIEWAAVDPAVVPPDRDLRTGYLVVPERRGTPGAGTVRLPFVVMKSRSGSPRPDPVLVSAGGPGGSILGRARGRARNPLLEDRDVILLEQRGTHHAEPALTGPRIADALRSGWSTRLNGDPDPAVIERALLETRREYEARAIDLSGYTTKDNAADIADLRRLLGLGAWNLYGSSYSTKIVLTVLRDSPEGVRAVILDSVLDLESDWDEEAPANILDAFRRLMAEAREREPLRPRLEGFEARWRGFLEAANRRPVEVALASPSDGRPLIVRLDAAGVMNCIYAGLEDASVIPRLPLIADEACRGRTDVLAPLAEAYLASSQGFAWGARLAVWCGEELPFERPELILRPAGLPDELARFVQTAVPFEALSAWPQGRPDEAENRPVHSDVPALIAAGEFDPDTPVAWSRRAASRLPNAQLVVFAGMSHVPLFSHPEAGRIMRAFLDSPRDRVDPGRTAERRPFAAALK
jgi:pimeloyl-ACP methyl ester carboxylesterase